MEQREILEYIKRRTKRRLNERLTNPDKRWKFEPQDLENERIKQY